MSRFIFSFLCMFCSLFIPFGLLGIYRGTGLLPVFFISAFISLFGSIIVLFTSDKIGALFSKLIFGMRTARWSFREQLSADFEKARNRKEERRFEEALTIIDRVLDEAPDFPDALCLKAEILWEGFRDSAAAKWYLKKVMQEVPKDETIYRWASSYYDEVTGIEKLRETSLPPNAE